ncbi:MAG: hypothetical protein LBE71_05775 [Dysgonamonadaceae bacterium]|nr:hypothetical protein [Dysgonamonadaceae bacterium]
MYRLTRRECLYVATKYNDEARAILILRGEELEEKNLLESRARRASQAALGEKMIITVPMGRATNQICFRWGFFLGLRGRCVDCRAATWLAMTGGAGGQGRKR